MKPLVIAPLFFVMLFFALAPATQAELNGKKVIFVHGFQFDALNPTVSDEAIKQGAIDQAGDALNRIIDDYLFYDSSKRLVANSAVLAAQIRNFEAQGICSDGCFFVTGSTGDLVARFVISRLGQWDIDSNQFHILLSFDIVGAGGGTEAADTIVGLANGSSLSRKLIQLLTKAFFGVSTTIKPGDLLGIINDLRPSIARRHASGNYDVPRLRIAAGKGTPFISRFFIKGRDDGLVPLHSACGSARNDSIESCTQKIQIDGKVANADGPKLLRFNHFPIIMATDMSHTDIDYKGKLVAVNNNTSFNHSTVGSTEYSVAEKTVTKGFWVFKSKYRTIIKPKGQLAIEFFIEEFD